MNCTQAGQQRFAIAGQAMKQFTYYANATKISIHIQLTRKLELRFELKQYRQLKQPFKSTLKCMGVNANYYTLTMRAVHVFLPRYNFY